jgi:hypothetical protein
MTFVIPLEGVTVAEYASKTVNDDVFLEPAFDTPL